jgi:SRSO17 transposase
MEAAMAMLDDATCDLDVWLTPFLDVMGRKTRRTWAPFYVRGLLGPGERKSLQPMAMQLGLGGHDQLQHFIASPAWDDAPLWTVLAQQADRMVGGLEAVLVIDDTALPKKGTLSVGVARQYCGQLGKQANCQALVSLTLAGREVPLPVGLRLFLPAEWINEPARCAAAGVPEAAIVARSKGEIALAELDRVRAAGVRFGLVLSDAGYGASAAFRHGLDERGLRWAVGIARNQKVYDRDVQLIPPTGRKRRLRPDQEPDSAEAVLAGHTWRRVTWRHGCKGPLAARFAAVRVRVGDGATFGNNRHLPGEELWLVGEWRTSGERKYYLSNLPRQTSRRALVAAIKARWVCEQGHQQLKQELGLGHFEGRSWTGLHRHALMTCIAFAYLQHRRLKAAGRGKKGGPQRTTSTALAA